MFNQRRTKKNRIREKNLRIQKTKKKCTNSQSYNVYSVQLLLTLIYYKKKRTTTLLNTEKTSLVIRLFNNYILCKKSIDILIYYINET